MKIYSVKTKEDAISLLNNSTEGRWEGHLLLIDEAIGINIRWLQNACKWRKDSQPSRFDEIVKTIYKNRKKINLIEL